MLKDFWTYLLGRLQNLLAICRGNDVVYRRRRSRHRRFAIKEEQRDVNIMRWVTLACIILCVVMFLVGAVKLIGYGIEYLTSQQSSGELRQTYYEAQKDAASAGQTDANPADMQETPPPAGSGDMPAASGAPGDEESPEILRVHTYPDNPNQMVNSRFQSIRKVNRDIVGWLTINGMLDEPVVRRNNIFYMTHDYHGRENINGAIFLDEIISLDKRPYTLILYGHNMRNGTMFGHLYDYDDLAYYKANPFITFDSIYEDGRYVIFAAAHVNVGYADQYYLDVGKLISNNVKERSAVLDMLCEASVISSGVTVRADDQVLLLVTCVGDDNVRRVVAARRIREDETEESVAALVQQSTAREKSTDTNVHIEGS